MATAFNHEGTATVELEATFGAAIKQSALILWSGTRLTASFTP